jgi:hypothetical protein
MGAMNNLSKLREIGRTSAAALASQHPFRMEIRRMETARFVSTAKQSRDAVPTAGALQTGGRSAA